MRKAAKFNSKLTKFNRVLISQLLAPYTLKKERGQPNERSTIAKKHPTSGPGGEDGTSVNQKIGL